MRYVARTNVFGRLGVACAAWFVVSAASAQTAAPAPPGSTTAPPTADATSHFQRGVELYQEQDFSGALVELRRAYDLAPTYKMLFNIGQVCYQLTDYACALRSFEDYLEAGGGEISSDRKAEVNRELGKLRARVGKLEIDSNQAGATISIDDVVVGTTPFAKPLVVSAGKRRVVAAREGFSPVARVVEVAGTDSLRVQLDFARASAGNPSAAAAGPRYAARWDKWSWVGLGATAAFGITSGVLGGTALGASSDLRSMRYAAGDETDDIRAKRSDVKSLALASDVFLGAAVLSFAATLVYTFAHHPRRLGSASPQPSSALGLAPRGATFGGSF